MSARPPAGPFPPAVVAGLLVVRFALELAALVLVALGVLDAMDSSARWVVAIAAAVLTAAVWGTFVAPRSRRRLRDPRRLVVEMLVFLAGTAGLVRLTGSPVAWLGLTVAAVVALLVRMSGAPA